MNNPWECPRCQRINAPFNPSCFCKPDDKVIVKPTDEARYLTPEEHYKMIDDEKRKIKTANKRCFICNGFHESGNSCATL